jgi:hypothetical protein
MRLRCLVVNAHRSTFPVEVPDDMRVEDLRERIVQKYPKLFADIEDNCLDMFAAKTTNGQWLSSSDPKVNELATTAFSAVPGIAVDKLDLAETLGTAFAAIGQKQVHVLVVMAQEHSVLGYARSLLDYFIPWGKRQKVEQLVLWCLAVGRRGAAFSVTVDKRGCIEDVQQAIMKKKEKNPVFQRFDPEQLRLVLAKTDTGEWLADTAPQVTDLAFADMSVVRKLGEKTLTPQSKLASLFDAVRSSQVHVLVLPPELGAGNQALVSDWIPKETAGKRTPADEWFPTEMAIHTVVLDGGHTRNATYLEMVDFPTIDHPMVHFNKIMERESDVVIFDQLMTEAAKFFGKSANLLVTGNPGIGKSRFYLYCAFRLTRKLVGQDMPPFTLVLNFDNEYLRYSWTEEIFDKISTEEAEAMRNIDNVLRLIEARSTMLTAWRGVSIRFSSPSPVELNNFTKVLTITFISPTWSLEELRGLNELLEAEWALSDEELQQRYDRYGGVPRYIFYAPRNSNMKNEIEGVDAARLINWVADVRKAGALPSDRYSHKILEMKPLHDNFISDYSLDFLSTDIGQAVVNKLERKSLGELSAFAVAHMSDKMAAPLCGRIYELLSHRWFLEERAKTLLIRQLDSSDEEALNIPDDMELYWFHKLSDITGFSSERWGYYRPHSETFALDAFIVAPSKHVCYGLQMTMNKNHGIKSKGIRDFLHDIERLGYAIATFKYVFLVPSKLAPEYTLQSLQTAKDTETKQPGELERLRQCVAPHNLFALQR